MALLCITKYASGKPFLSGKTRGNPNDNSQSQTRSSTADYPISQMFLLRSDSASSAEFPERADRKIEDRKINPG
jgi:hypothetical protein